MCWSSVSAAHSALPHSAARRHPLRVARTLDARRFGRNAVTLKTFYGVVPFMDRNGYDVVHCHFGPNGVLGVDFFYKKRF